MDRNTVLLEIEGMLGRITLNRPQALNAMDEFFMHGLERATSEVAEQADVRVVLIQGAGRAFCAGLDLNMMATRGMPDDMYATQERAFRNIELMDKIVIAAIHGYCLGGGVQLAIACDIRVCSTESTLGLPAVNEGLFPGMAPFRLPRLIGLGPARRLILSGELISADEALRLNLVDYVIAADQFDAGVNGIVKQYLEAPRAASTASKTLLRRAFDGDFDSAYAESVPLLRECLDSPEVAMAKEAWKKRSRR